MTITLHVALIVAALLCFLIAALSPIFNWSLGKFSALAWGLFLWLLAISFVT